MINGLSQGKQKFLAALVFTVVIHNPTDNSETVQNLLCFNLLAELPNALYFQQKELSSRIFQIMLFSCSRFLCICSIPAYACRWYN